MLLGKMTRNFEILTGEVLEYLCIDECFDTVSESFLGGSKTHNQEWILWLNLSWRKFD